VLHRCVCVDVEIFKEECKMARYRKHMNMQAEIGRECDCVVLQKKKKKECIQRIMEFGQQTGVADIN
jgi:hypothetical protein